MSYLDRLLEGVEVEWKLLGEVAELNRGKTITAKTKKAGNIPVISGGQTPAYYNSEFNRNGETITVAGSGAYAGFVMYWNEPIFVSDAFSVKPYLTILNTKYTFHFLLSNQSLIHNLQKGSGVPHVYPKDLAKLQIPIPCPDNPQKSLEIQKEIVRILDTFTKLTEKLTEELTEELAARKKQYNYYRDQLLSFEEGDVEWKMLEEVCLTISAGGDVPEKCVKGQVNPTDEFPYPVYANATDSNGLYGYTDQYKIECDAVTISARGAKVGFHTIRTEKFTAIIRLIVLVADKTMISTKYLNYILDMTPIGGTKGGIPQLTVPSVRKIKIPIPSLEVQERIVTILDKFDTLTTSISEGLPKEIELRKKQYEYYRDMLLTFPKKENV